MTIKHLVTMAMIASTLALSGCASIADTAPNATVQVSTDVQEVPASSSDKPAMSATQSVIEKATVIAVDRKTREVTVKDEKGEPYTFIAEEGIGSLDLVKEGDIVKLEYVRNFSFRVLEAKDMEAAAAEVALVGHTEEGEMPGIAVIDKKVEIFLVEEIDLENNTYKLKNKDGIVRQFKEYRPSDLQKSKVGDILVVSYTRGVAISIEKSPAK